MTAKRQFVDVDERRLFFGLTRMVALAALVGAPLITACKREENTMETSESSKGAPPTSSAPMTLEVTSAAFNNGARIQREYSGEGRDKSPPLAWTGASESVAEYALIVRDPDAPMGVWYHWVLYNIPADVTSVPAGLPRNAELQSPVQARQGLNSWQTDNVGYRGPMPPKGHGPHRYLFTVYALDTHIELAPNLATADALMAKMDGHAVARGELMGTYERK